MLNWSLSRNEETSSFRYSENFKHRRISIRSSHRKTSGPSSTSDLKVAILDMIAAAASWSKDCTISFDPGSTQLLEKSRPNAVEPLTFWKLSWHEVEIDQRRAGIGSPAGSYHERQLASAGRAIFKDVNRCTCESITWFTTSKQIATVVLGVKEDNFHADVPPMPISVSATHGSFLNADTAGPIKPQIYFMPCERCADA